VFYRQARRFSERPLLHHHDGSAWRPKTWAETRQMVLAEASALIRAGVRSGDHVVLIAENRLEWPVSDLAIQSVGAITVPIYATTPPAVAQGIAADAGAVLAIAGDENLAAKVPATGVLRTVALMDADLQHPPQVIPRLIAEWKNGSKVVHTIRIDSRDLFSAKWLTSRWFYSAFSSLSGVRMEPGMADFRLLDGQVVNNLLRLPEQGMFLRGLVHWVGYPSSRVTFQARERASGRSKYTFWRMLQFAWNGVTSFSVVPLRLGVLLGFLTSIVAFGELIYAIYMKATGRTVPGWASAVGVVSLLFGILFVLIGIIGEYVGRILIEVRSRPRFLISECVGFKGPLRED